MTSYQHFWFGFVQPSGSRRYTSAPIWSVFPLSCSVASRAQIHGKTLNYHQDEERVSQQVNEQLSGHKRCIR